MNAMPEYLVIDLEKGPDASDYPVSYTHEQPAPDCVETRTSQLWMRRISAGTFIMGSAESELGRYGNETRHAVRLSRDFLIGVFPVTQRQWELVMGNNPSYFKQAGPLAPVEQVTYMDICGYCRPWPYTATLPDASFIAKLRRKTRLAGLDLPTDAQWEYACRAGTETALYTGQDLVDADTCHHLDVLAWYEGNSLGSTHPVGEKLPNDWMLYDMLGNVWEWCRDWHDTPSTSYVLNPIGPIAGFSRTMRGGNWFCRAGECRCARRYDDDEARRSRYLGLRIAMN